MLTKSQFLKIMEHTGIRIKGSKLSKEDFRKVFGAKYSTPEWIVLIDYKLESPAVYLDHIEIEEDKLGRIILPASFSITKFGDFSQMQGNQSSFIGLVYQYAMKRNPRNVHYAYRLFLDSTDVCKNSGFNSLDEAKAECCKEAKNIIETELFDLT